MSRIIVDALRRLSGRRGKKLACETGWTGRSPCQTVAGVAWPKVVNHLAGLWARDPMVLRRHLDKHCYGFPRGRVTRPGKTLLILHGNDSPISDWKPQVIRRFNLQGRRIRTLFDEHEQTLPGDVKAVRKFLGGYQIRSGGEQR